MAANTTSFSASVSAIALEIFEIRALIAATLVQGADSISKAMTDIKSLRLTSTTWDQTVRESPTVGHLLFNTPIPEYRVPRLTKPENGRFPSNLLRVSSVYSGRSLISPSQVTFNPIMRQILLRFRAQLGCKPRGMDTVKIRLGHGKEATCFWMSYTNCRAEPHLDPEDEYTVEVDLWKKVGREVCLQYVCQPPVQRLRVDFLAESDAFSYGCERGSGTIVCEKGVQIGHVLAGLLDVLNKGGSREMYDLCGPQWSRQERAKTEGEEEVDQGKIPCGDDDDDDEVQIICDGNKDPNDVVWDEEAEHPDEIIWEDEAGDSRW